MDIVLQSAKSRVVDPDGSALIFELLDPGSGSRRAKTSYQI
jgi:hypothetical protein